MITESIGPRGARMICFHGETRSVSDWARHLEIPRKMLCERINKSEWPIEKALSIPFRVTARGTRYGDGYLVNGYCRKSIGGIQRPDHIRIAEKALGKPLPDHAVVHHVNHNRSDNRNENLVICQNDAYHQHIHHRERALNACGNANWRKCKYCKQYDNPSRLTKTRRGEMLHQTCANAYSRSLYQKRKHIVAQQRREKRTTSRVFRLKGEKS